MMNAEDAILIYEDVANITTQMLQAARNARWDDLVHLEQYCANRVHSLATSEAPIKYPANLRNRKLSLLRDILADDREIRNLTEPWMQQLDKLLQATRTERKLSNAYGGQQLG
jgi:flagellar protein FliT